ncbi:MAG: Gfo/Idh/MocA family oxidoreductase [Armatimonadetes bacterium]|nr:Gfo/Idh/MocA family oxidoreductase [Armatimonadota bacterium]
MSETVKVGIYGAGWVSGEHLRAYLGNPHCEVVAVGSRRLSSAQRLCQEHGVEADCCDDFERFLATPGLTAVSITGPNHVHAEQTIAAARAGKHVLIEKPVAVDRASLYAMRDAVRAAGVRSVASFVLRWNPLFSTIRALLAREAIGTLVYAEVDYWHEIGPWWTGYEWARTKASGGSAFLTGGCHAVDALRYFVQDEVVEVAAYAATAAPTEFEYPPTVVAVVKFAGGAVGKVSVSFEAWLPYQFNIDLLGTAGAIRDNRVFSRELLPGATDFATVPTTLPNSGEVTHHPFQGEIDHFIDCIRTGVESHVNLEDAVKTHEVCLAIDRAVAEGGPIRLPAENRRVVG